MKGTIPALFGLLLLAAPAAVQAQYTCTNNATIPNGVTSIPDYAFYDCTILTNVTIPDSVTSIGSSAFSGCTALKSVTIGSSVISIGLSAFQNCTALKSVTIPDSVISIGGGDSYYYPQSYGAFEGCTSLTNAIIGNGVTSIGNSAFNGCTGLKSVTIGTSVQIIGEYAFYSCGLTSVTIPDSVTTIGQSAFANCTGLKSVYFKGNAIGIDSSVFSGDNNATVYYLLGTTGWSSPFGGRPAVLWNPLIVTGDGSFGVRNNQFGFDIAGTTNIPIVVEACTTLDNPVWSPLQTLTLTNGLFYFSEPLQTNSASRYYRIRSP
ncbi:MAG: leucine-rich repeat domain-containing protein [Verrucomicrobiota bacterium]|jgi:hypothetical protein